MDSVRKTKYRMTVFQLVLVGFLSINIIGGLLLALPLATTSNTPTPLIDAFFTATSALCVTGSTVVNTATHWNTFGQSVIMILMEIGGLGVMTIVVFFFFFLGKRLNFRQQRVIQETLSLSDISQIGSVIRYVLLFSVLIQVLGAVVLSFDFVPRFGLGKGIFYGIFHSISAFCSGGFDLFGGNLMIFQENPLVMITLLVLIICGGLGFIVWRDILTFRRNRKLLLHTRFVLTSLAILITVSALVLWLSESNLGTFDHIPRQYRWIHYIFLAITPTTAGFSNVDYQFISMFGLFVTFILMFIGGAPGSTAGGVKASTVGVVIIYLISTMRNQQPTFAHRGFSNDVIKRALFITLFGLMLVLIGTLILLFTETLPQGRGLEYVLMEVISSFSTAGLSLGMTPNLTIIGKMVLMVLMFIGRVGLITFFWSSGSRQKEERIRYPEESILIG